jgi:riboflavin synthase
MFTGIITHEGSFQTYRRGKSEIIISAPQLVSQVNVGDSLSVDGVCLSLISKDKRTLSFSLSEETIRLTTLGKLKKGERLNLELPLTLSKPLGGHLITGHIDRTEKVSKITRKKEGMRFVITLNQDIQPFFIKKGSVAVNGISLTVADLSASSFEVEVIPITLKNSNIGRLKVGDKVNIECDLIGKYVYNWWSKENKV